MISEKNLLVSKKVTSIGTSTQTDLPEEVVNSIYYYLFNYSGYKLIFSYEENQATTQDLIDTGSETENGIAKKTNQKSILKMTLVLIVTMIMCFFAAFEISPENSQSQNDQPQMIAYNNQNDFMQKIDNLETFPLPVAEPRLSTTKTLPTKKQLLISTPTKKSLQRIKRQNHSMKPFNMIKKLLNLPIEIFMNVLRVLHLFKK